MDPFLKGGSYAVAMNPNDGYPTHPTMFKLLPIPLPILTMRIEGITVPLIHPTFSYLFFLRKKADMPTPKHKRQLTTWQVILSSREEHSSNVKTLKIACIPEVTFSSWFGTRVNFENPMNDLVYLLEVIWDESTTNL